MLASLDLDRSIGLVRRLIRSTEEEELKWVGGDEVLLRFRSHMERALREGSDFDRAYLSRPLQIAESDLFMSDTDRFQYFISSRDGDRVQPFILRVFEKQSPGTGLLVTSALRSSGDIDEEAMSANMGLSRMLADLYKLAVGSTLNVHSFFARVMDDLAGAPGRQRP